MSNEVVFIKPLARPHYPMERGKAHAVRVAHAGLKQEGIFIALSPVIKHTLAHTNTTHQYINVYSPIAAATITQIECLKSSQICYLTILELRSLQ